MYYVIYDGNCNLCVNLLQWLEAMDEGHHFRYAPMQDEHILKMFNITAQDCAQGMILIDSDHSDRRWQGSDAAEEIGRLIPFGHMFISLYRSLPGATWLGDRTYEQIRDNRYEWFGPRTETYQSDFPICSNNTCSKYL